MEKETWIKILLERFEHSNNNYKIATKNNNRCRNCLCNNIIDDTWDDINFDLTVKHLSVSINYTI